MTRDEYRQRAIELAPRGNDLPHAKANPALVRRIRANVHGWTRQRWADELGLHKRTIDKIMDYESWRHVK